MGYGDSLLFADSDLTSANHATAKHSPGQVFKDSATGIEYIYAQASLSTDNTSGNTLIAGRPMYWNSRTSGTTKSGTGDATDKSFAGVLQTTVTSGNFTWLIRAGDNVACLVVNATTAQLGLVPDQGAAGVLTSVIRVDTAAHLITDLGFGLVGRTLETGKNPATPLTTNCKLYRQ